MSINKNFYYISYVKVNILFDLHIIHVPLDKTRVPHILLTFYSFSIFGKPKLIELVNRLITTNKEHHESIISFITPEENSDCVILLTCL
jgi:DNA polymerase III delta subunit